MVTQSGPKRRKSALTRRHAERPCCGVHFRGHRSIAATSFSFLLAHGTAAAPFPGHSTFHVRSQILDVSRRTRDFAQRERDLPRSTASLPAFRTSDTHSLGRETLVSHPPLSLQFARPESNARP